MLDLTGIGLQLTSLADSTAHFDYTGSGFANQTAWVGKGEGLLVFQPSAQTLTQITAQNLIGAVSGDGFADLAQLESNGDGVITDADPSFQNLRVWVDANQNGTLDPGELFTLSQLGITSIEVAGPEINATVAGNEVVEEASFTVEGDAKSHMIAEVNFQTDPELTIFQVPAGFVISRAALELPDLDGYGEVANLRVAATLDPSLLADAQALISGALSMTGAAFDAAFQALVQEWVGASSIDPESRGGFIDARNLAVVYAFYGIDQDVETVYQIDPNWHSGPLWEQDYQEIVDELKIRFASQVALDALLQGDDVSNVVASPFLPFALIAFDSTTDTISVDFNALVKQIVSFAPQDPAAAQSYYETAFNILKSLRVDLFAGSVPALISATLEILGSLGVSAAVEQDALIGFGSDNTVDLSGSTGSLVAPVDTAVFVGGGDKQITGGSNNVYVVAANYGNDSIADFGSNAILVLQGVKSTDVSLGRPLGTNDLLITNNQTGNVLTLSSYFSNGLFSQIGFSDTRFTQVDVINLLRVEANSIVAEDIAVDPSMSQIGEALAALGFEVVAAGDVQQTAISADANVFVIAGQGCDTVTLEDTDSTETSATFLYSFRDGNFEVQAHTDSYSSFTNTLQLTDLAFADVTLSRVDANLLVTVNATGKVITVTGEFNSLAQDGIQEMTFTDGATMNRAQIQAAALYRAGPGDVTVTAQDGSATLVAGPGNDVLVAGDADNDGAHDTFIYGSADGNLAIDAHVRAYDAIFNTLQLTDLNAADLTFSRTDNDLAITVNATGAVITVPGAFNSSHSDGIQQIAFADGSTWNLDQIQAAAWYRAGPGDITLTAGNGRAVTTANGPATFVAGSGNDTLVAGDGAATFVAGPGNDVLVAGDADNDGAHDTFIYGSADGNLAIDAHVRAYDAIFNTLQLTDLNAADLTFSRTDNDLAITVNATGAVITVPGAFNSSHSDGIQQIAFADGSTWNLDQIQAAAYIRGTPDSAADAYDLVDRGYNGVTYDLGAGDHGQTVVVHEGAQSVIWDAADGNETFGVETSNYINSSTLNLTNLKPSDVTFSRQGEALFITNNATGKVFDSYVQFGNPWQGFGTITFSDGTTLSQSQIVAKVASDSQDNTSIDPAVGTPYTPPSGSDTAEFGSNDAGTLNYITGSHTITFTPGEDSNVAVDYDDYGSKSTVDVFRYAAADGNVWIRDTSAAGDTLEFTDLTSTDVTFAASYNRDSGDTRFSDLLITVTSTGKQITLDNFNNWSVPSGPETFVFADGVTMTKAQIQAAETNVSSPLPAQIRFDGAFSTKDLDTPVGAPTVADVYFDSGNDTITTRAGADTFVYASADGNVQINDYQAQTDTLAFTDLNASDVTFSTASGSPDLQITVNATGKTIDVLGQFSGQGIGKVTFADGTTMAAVQIAAAAGVPLVADVGAPYTPPAGSDTAEFGSNDAGTLNYITGSHTITFTPGQDSNVAVDYDDYGSKSTVDVFRYAAADGNVWIRDTSAAGDTLEFTDLTSTDVTFAASYNRDSGDTRFSDLLITVTSTGKQITLDNFNNWSVPSGPETFVFADGVTMTKAQIQAAETNVSSPLPAQIRFDGAFSTKDLDTPVGAPTVADVYFDSGNDTITTRAGADTFVYASADGNVQINDYQAQTDTLAFTDLNASDVTFSTASGSPDLQITVNATGKTIDVLGQFSGQGIGKITFADGTTLDHGGIDTAAWYRAGTGNDTLTSYTAGATFQAGAGSDTFVDGYDQGTFVYSSANGNLAVQAHTDAAHTDTLSLINLNVSDLTFSRNGGDLLIGVNATSNAITVAGEFNSPDQDGIQKIAFANGTTWNHDQIVAAAQTAPPVRA